MMWYWPWTDNIKKRACRYLLQRYLGNYLEGKLTLDQLSVDLYNGTGSVCDVSLDCEALNILGDEQSWPLEIVDGYVKEISVTIPWSTILRDDSIVVVNGLSLTVQPKVQAEPASSMLESMWSSMSSSMQLATECLREEVGPQDVQPLEGVEMFAQAIDSILSRVKVKFVNTKLRIEHVPKNSDKGIALEIHIDNISYSDEAGLEPTPDVTDPDKSKTYVVTTHAHKKINFDGVSLYTDDFPSKMRTMSRSLIMEKSASSTCKDECLTESSDAVYQSTISDVFHETLSVLPPIESEFIQDRELVGQTEPKTEEKVPTFDEDISQPDPILFAKLTGQQELALKLKYNEEIEGPKIEVNMLLGSFILFLSPRQFHTLNELGNALSQPQLEDTSNIPLRSGTVNLQCKPMTPADYQLVEAQLLGNLERDTARPSAYGWSGPSYDDSDTESEKFLPMTNPKNVMMDSFTSTTSSMSASVMSGLSSQPRIKRNKKEPNVDGDPTADTSHICLRINSVSCILLHKDILIPMSPGSNIVSSASAKKMHEVATQFFNQLLPFYFIDGSKSEYDTANQELNKAIQRNHLRLIMSEITVDGTEKDTTNGKQTTCEASISQLVVRECLYYKTEGDTQSESYDLVYFDWKDEEDNASNKSAAVPNIKINFKQTSKYVRRGSERKPINPMTDITVHCMPLHVDVDLTLVERMSATLFGAPRTTASASPQQMNISLHCPTLEVTLRFPIADLRPGISRECRRARTDYLSLVSQDATAIWHRAALTSVSTLTITSTTLDLYYNENEHLPATHVARASMDHSAGADILKGNDNITSLPTITFQLDQNDKGPFDAFCDDTGFEPATSNPMTASTSMLNNLKCTQPSPFSGKKMAHQSTTKHEGSPNDQEDELIIPGNAEEMNEFTNSCIERSHIRLDFSLPILSLQLESKHLYEIIYNRINSDLLLWEPQIIDPFEIDADVFNPIYPAFSECKGGYESDSGSDSSDENNLYYSTYDTKSKKSSTTIKSSLEKKDTHNFCLTFKVNKGLLTIYAPVRDSNKRVVPGQMGELVLEANQLSMCHVSGLNGIPKTAQMCLRAAKATLYHEAILTIPSEKPCLRLYGRNLPSYMKPTIYPSSKGVFLKETVETKDMFAMALKLAPESDTPNMKSLCIALSIEQASLRHRGATGLSWLSQLTDVLDVLDYSVPGYTPSTVLSQLHVHVWDCCLDYRPLYLPIRAVVALGNFSYSSSLIAETNTSCLRFIAQDCDLFLSSVPVKKSKGPVPLDDDKLPNLHKDYVCVVDVGLFELSLRMDDKNTASASSQLQTDLSASNNLVTIHTCWDSASALFRLVTYVASDGDAALPDTPPPGPATPPAEETLVGLEEKPAEAPKELSAGEVQHIHDLMDEALKDIGESTMTKEDLMELMEALKSNYYFPDECVCTDEKKKSKTDSSCSRKSKPTHSQVAEELGDPSRLGPCPSEPRRPQSRSSENGNNTDDEYDILNKEEYNIDDELEEPKVTWYFGEPPPIIENHFSVPTGPADVLEAPKSFPAPVVRYNLCEMSITWYIYAGNDFDPVTEAKPKKKVTIDDGSTKKTSPTSSKRDKTYEPYESASPSSGAAYSRGVSWSAGAERVKPTTGPTPPSTAHPAVDIRTRGGRGRDTTSYINLKLTKVRYVHETYPVDKEHASRHTLAIQNIEVLDRVKGSNINKMLSLYRRPNEPERKNAYMLVVKVAHLRTNSSPPALESCLKVSVMPLWFILDQDTLNFLITFFSKLGTDEHDEEAASAAAAATAGSSGASRQVTPTHRPPVMSVTPHLRDPPPTPTSLGDIDALSLDETVNRDDGIPLMEQYEAERLVSANLIQLEEDFNRLGMTQDEPTTSSTPDTESVHQSPIYFRRVIFCPAVPIRLDYQGKRVDLSAGPIAGLLMGLGQLNCSELTLKRLDYRLGLLGVDKLVQWAVQEWLSDIKRHQLPSLLSGIGPMHSFLQFVTGIRDLVWLPVEQWRRDGRFVLGLRRGAASFTARTAVAAIDITTNLLHLIQATAETAFDMLTPSPTLPLQDAYERRERRRRRRHDPATHPADIREGVASAYQTVREGIAETAATVALAARCSSGAGVLRHLPGAAVAPLALAAAGAADLLGGVRASLHPATSRERAHKWRATHHHHPQQQQQPPSTD